MPSQYQVLLFSISLNCMAVVIIRCSWCENMWVHFSYFFPQDDHVETCGSCYILEMIKQFRRQAFVYTDTDGWNKLVDSLKNSSFVVLNEFGPTWWPFCCLFIYLCLTVPCPKAMSD